ncbi:MAG TPA: GntR family transcriptional regulator [Rhizomicrobium sp.]|nr:GntR family transcriptional regulator [Rhizomicrobium sp.]
MAVKRPKASRLQSELARKILFLLKDDNAQPGHRLVEWDLCAALNVSRTPVRGALKLLAAEGIIAPRPGRGFVLAKMPPVVAGGADGIDQQHQQLFEAMARARGTGALGDQFTQQELVRRFHVRLATVMAVLRELAELGLVERKPGNGWAFAADPSRILNESDAFRRALEPQMLLQPGFKLDRAWAQKARTQLQKLRKKSWRAGDGLAFHAIDADFHEQLARCSGNRTMLRAIQRQNQLRDFLIGRVDYPMEQVHSAIDSHLEILAVLEAGHADKAAALMLHHLTQSAVQSHKEEPNAPRLSA